MRWPTGRSGLQEKWHESWSKSVLFFGLLTLPWLLCLLSHGFPEVQNYQQGTAESEQITNDFTQLNRLDQSIQGSFQLHVIQEPAPCH